MSKFNIEEYLDSLPDDVEKINVSNKGIKYLPDLSRFKKLEILYCDENNLTSLPVLPKNLKELSCYDNKLTSLPNLPEKLEKLFCLSNNLTLLPDLPENLEILNCKNNKLKSLPYLGKHLNMLMLLNNPIHDIVYGGNIKIINKKIKIWNNFRYLYYCLKYRKRFLKMMEPIIKKRYHPSYLYDLKEEDDLDEKLNEW